MMELITASILLLACSMVLAQDSSNLFNLKLESTNTTLDGQLLSACHAGAAIEQLCLAGTDGHPSAFNTFGFNVTITNPSDYSEAYETGFITWELEASSTVNISSGLSISLALDSNLASPLLNPATGNLVVGFDEANKLFLYSGDLNPATYVPVVFPTYTAPRQLYQVRIRAQ